MAQKFRAVLMQAGKTATGIEVPVKIVEAFGAGKRVAVQVTIKKFTYPSTIAVMGGKFLIPVSKEVRAKVGVAAGDNLDVSLELDTAPRVLEIPKDFLAALKKNTAAKKFFETLSYSNKRRHTLSVEGAKTPETRLRRIAKSVEILAEGKI